MKGKTHVYMANLLIKDLEKGHVDFPQGLGTYLVPAEVASAILNYKSEFRAGATGPDFYPDVQVGQTIVHPQDSGFWLELMFNEFSKISVNDPQRQPALSYLMGFMMHYATDLYGHEYVNHWANGWFPSYEEALVDPEKMKIIARHMLVEAYMDNKVPKNCDTTMAMPLGFVKNCFLNEEALNRYTSITGLKYAEEMRQYALNKSQDSTTNMLDVTNYFKSWEQDLERGINEWFNTWHKINVDMVEDGKTLTDAKNDLNQWVDNYFVYMTPAPDMIIDFMKLLDQLNIFKPIKEAIKQKAIEYLNALVKAATGIDVQNSIEEFKNMMKQPELYLNSGILFSDTNITEQLDQDFGNFGTTDNSLNQSFHAFYQCLNMGKLCLLGTQNLNELIKGNSSITNDSYFGRICTGSIESMSVRIKTASRSWSNMTTGTDDNVYFAVGLNNGQIYELLLDIPGENDFEAGDDCTYQFTLPRRVGYDEIQYFRLRKDYIVMSDDWKVANMTVKDQIGRTLFDQSLNHTLVGKEEYVLQANTSSLADNQVLPIDSRVMSFLYSLDGMGKNDTSNPTSYKQWTDSGNLFYSNQQLYQNIYTKLFDTPCQITIENTNQTEDGRLEVFVRGQDQGLWHIWQVAPNSGWSSWDNLGGQLDMLTSARNQDGRLEVFARGTDKALWHIWQEVPNGGWSSWQSLGGQIEALEVGQNQDGRLEVFAIGTDQGLWHIWQVAPNSGWTEWNSLGGSIDRLKVGRNLDGRLEVFGRGTDKSVWHIWQVAPNSGWTEWNSLGGWIDLLEVAENEDGRLEVFARGNDKALWHIWQVEPNGCWSNWENLGGWIDMLKAEKNQDGRLEVFVRGNDSGVWHIWQVAPNSGWGSWCSLEGKVDMLDVRNNQDGRLEIFARGTDNGLWHMWQVAPNSGWSSWESLGGWIDRLSVESNIM